MPKYSLLNQDINTSFLNIETTWAGMRSPLLKKQIGHAVPDSFCELIKGETLNYFQNEKQAKSFSKACARQILADKRLLSGIKRLTVRLSGRVMKLAADNFPPFNLSDAQMISFLKRARDLQKDLAAWGMAVAFADIYGEISDQVIKVFSGRENLQRPINYYLNILPSPNRASLTAMAYEDICRHKNDKNLQRKYFWLDQGYIGRGLNLKQIKNIRCHYKIIIETAEPEKKLLSRELKLSSAEKNLLAVSADMVYLKSLRSDSRQALYVVANNIIDILARCWRVPAKHLEVLSTKELISAIKDPSSLNKNLSERWTHSLIIPQSADDYRIICGGGIDEYLVRYIDISSKQAKETSELKGQVAQPGKARGRVRLVFGSQHNSKVKRGDILVSVSTSPQLLPAMKLAAAFITDMGGITSHAAIVAREFRKPCIVGTKNATKILHDGDLVEVDADKGVVKIIKKK